MRYKRSVRDGAAWNTPELSTRKPQVSMLDRFVHSTRLILSVEWPEGMEHDHLMNYKLPSSHLPAGPATSLRHATMGPKKWGASVAP
jgi:hypothetical protein